MILTFTVILVGLASLLRRSWLAQHRDEVVGYAVVDDMDLSEESDATGLPHRHRYVSVFDRLPHGYCNCCYRHGPAKCVPERLSHAAIVHCWPLCSNSWQCRRGNLVY